jgi:uncharacterized membrane protein YtjA (UPF0391 family)
MLHFAIAFTVVALIAAMFGSAGLAGAVAAAQPFFVVFIVMALVSFAIGMTKRR